jgi:Tol biopolymer transport system component
MIGETFSHYRVVEKLGGGGMGVVYRAEDTRLRRSVAMKVLPPELTRDHEAKQRFILEAQAASALDHPNICTIFEIDETPDGQLFLVMAYYAGETLKKLIERGPLAIDEALDYAIQIAQGLVKAHAAGIVHRDIKPANVLVTADGIVKIVDFGLAKLLGQTGMTRTGTRLGTVAYMAPEQTMGKELDVRADIWSLGVVLYEMIAGQLPFKGEHDFAIASAVVNHPAAPLTSVRTQVPLELERIVSRALAKSPADRYQTAADFLSELRQLRRSSSSQPVEGGLSAAYGRPATSRSRMAAVALAAIAALGVLGYFAAGRIEPSTPPLPRLTNPKQVAGSVNFEAVPSWSPDSRMIAYQSNQAGYPDIWIVQVDGGPPINRTADNGAPDMSPSWSPDGRQIAFWSIRDGQGGVFVMPALSGSARRIATTYESIPAWSPDGSELAYSMRDSTSDWLEIHKLADGTTRRVPLPGRKGNQRLDPAWSPDGRFIVYADARNHTSQVTQLWVLKLADGSASAFTDGRMMEWTPSWSPDSRTLFYTSNRGGTPDLWHQRFGDDGTPLGPPGQISVGLGVITAAISPDGKRVAYDKGRGVGNAWRVPVLPDREATWSDATQLTFDNALVEFIDVSPDGTRVAVSSDRNGNPDLWIMPSGGGDMQQFTMDPTPDWSPAWSPDGSEIAFYAYRSGNREIWVQPVAGGPARQLTRGESESVFPRWSRDGKTLAYSSRQGERNEIWTVPAAGGDPKRLIGDPAFENTNPEFSGDGQSIVFRSNRSGGMQIFRRPVDGGSAQLVHGSGSLFRLSPDGKTIYFFGFSTARGFDQKIWSVSHDRNTARPVADLSAKRGDFNTNSLATDGKFLYFTWAEGASDIWVMDISLPPAH